MSFGLGRVGKWSEIDSLLRDCPTVRPTVADRLTRAAYHTEYGIYNHASPNSHPLADVMMHPKEDTWEGGPYLTQVRRYLANRYSSTFNLTLEEYFNLPFWLSEFLHEIVKSTNQNKSLADRQQEQEWEALNRQLGEK